ncbi:Protein kinase-like domain [Pseudocohnilembus persalinus]|uniref:non-specific serine/threonine protein kinase n=1 Tax=Pseudocohnilembus persalinus TaxID=266149 RepID=A0A0V0R3U2_PSEPJ|nr:Protein kinase-like domain [Pseudocohnilembus persalinus]|eukprot:KRX09165.1 Protein kinase-like domain [Pseudocohnilembus persalinus]
MEKQKETELKQILEHNKIKYADSCILKGIQYYDYENVKIQWGEQQSKTTSLVFEHINNTNFQEVFPQLTDFDALDYSHSQGIMHRDIKPHNIMIDYDQKQIRLIDWGLADFYFPGKEYNVRVASRYYKSPELLVDYTYYDYSLDIWSFGCVLAGIVFQKKAFFKGKDNYDQLEQITRVLGTKELFQYLQKYSIDLDEQFQYVLGQNKKQNLKNFSNPQNNHLVNDEVLDLLQNILLYDHFF